MKMFQDSKILKVSAINERALVRIMLVLHKQGDDRFVELVNHRDAGVVLLPTANIQSPLRKSLIQISFISLITALIYGVFVFILYVGLDKIKNKLQDETSKLEIDLKTAMDNLDKTDIKIKENSRANAKIRLVLLSRLSDYAKELEFWRNTIRKLLYSSENKDAAAKQLISQVSKNLKTYTTLTDEKFDFDEVEVLAQYLKDSNEKR